MITGRKIELLAPAKNLTCGIEAVNHGADAVYIGAPLFSARAAAGNSVADIAQLVQYAHRYFVKVYAALNTILKEEELEVASGMIRQLYDAGIDALIIQDMAILEMDLPPVPLHASTQMDNRTPEKVRILEDAGFSRVVLARELSLSQIREIAGQTHVPLEVFIHGALCVSYSGQCYMSQAMCGRSANRGECAQYCRLPYTLQDATGRILASNKHLLSLKDLNLSDHLEALLDAGVTSLKIEGRLKEVSYVKNLTAYYRKKLDELFHRRMEYIPASSGYCNLYFTPDPHKSFNRGFTDYFLHERKKDTTSVDTPKSVGEPVGRVKDIGRNYFTVAGTASLANGDGLCFFDEKGTFRGFRVNRVEANKVFPAEMPVILTKTLLYRNFNQAFEKQLAVKSAERKIRLRILFREEPGGSSLSATDEDGCEAFVDCLHAKAPAKTPQEEQVRLQLTKLGNTVFEAEDVRIVWSEDRFIPASVLTDMRRQLVDKLLSVREKSYLRAERKYLQKSFVFPEKQLSYRGNVLNSLAERFYKTHGVTKVDPAFESKPIDEAAWMFTKHCLRYQLGYCTKTLHRRTPIKEPLYLLSEQGRFELEFDCKTCEMRIYRSR